MEVEPEVNKPVPVGLEVEVELEEWLYAVITNYLQIDIL